MYALFVSGATAEISRKAKLPEPVFEEFGFSFRATLSLIKEQPLQLDETTLAIRAALTAQEAKEGLSSQQLADALGISARAIRARMPALITRGLVTVVGKNARDPQRKYFWRS